jgi:hypothetical protein
MSDQPGIPAIMVFPPFSPGARQAEPGSSAPAVDEAPPPEPTPSPTAPEADAAAPAGEPWAAGSASEVEGAPEAGPAETPITEEEDLPWLEVPTPRADAEQAAPELKADDSPNWMDWVRDADAPAEDDPAASAEETTASAEAPAASADETAASEGDAEPTSVEELAPDAGDWAAAPEAAPEPWRAPEAAAADPWQAPQPDAPAADWPESGADLELPDPELYDLPAVTPSDSPWAASSGDAEADEGGEPEPAWELPSQGSGDAPPAWESFTSSSAAAESPAAQPASAASPAAGGGFAGVAERLEGIARALRDDPGAFLSGAQGGGDPLALLVAGFVLGWQARQGS